MSSNRKKRPRSKNRNRTARRAFDSVKDGNGAEFAPESSRAMLQPSTSAGASNHHEYFGKYSHKSSKSPLPISGITLKKSSVTKNPTPSSNHGNYRTRRSISSSSAQSAPTDSSNDEDYEIPGFYYDKAKKRYFKILPNTNTNSGVVTSASIKTRQKEEKRLLDLKSLNFGSSRGKNVRTVNFLPFVSKRSFHGSNQTWTSDCIKVRISEMKLTSQVKIFPEPVHTYQILEHMWTMLPTRDSKKILGLWSMRAALLQRIQLLKLGQDSSNLVVEPFGAVLMKSIAKVTHLVWAPTARNVETDSTVLYTTMCLLGTSPSLALFRKLDSVDIDNFISKEFNLGRNAAWTCAWNSYDQKFSVGSERKALLIDFRTRGMWELKTGGSDILTQQFSKENVLFSGAKNGNIYLHDQRASTNPSLALKHKSAVSCLRLLSDENYFIATDFSGKLCLWDLRRKKIVRNYREQVNEYSKLSFGVDEGADIVYGAGQDSYTRIWSLSDGRLLKTIPPAFPASRATIPCMSYSQYWPGGRSGLFMGVRDEILFYSL